MGQTWEDSSFFKTLDCPDCCGTAMPLAVEVPCMGVAPRILDDEAMPLTRAWCLLLVLAFSLTYERKL